MPYLFDDSTKRFLTAINKIFPLSEKSKEKLAKCMTYQSLEKDEILVKGREAFDKMYFVEQGQLRSYVLGEDENTKIMVEEFGHITKEGEIYFPMSTLALGRAVEQCVQAVEPSRLICLRLEDLTSGWLTGPKMTFSALLALGKFIAKGENLKRKLLEIEPERRLELMRKIDPDLVSRVPEEHMRSYLDLE